MTAVEIPRTGDIGLVKVRGLTGWFIRVGQWLNGSSWKDAKWEHSMLCVGTDWALEGQPGGAVISRVSSRYEGEKILWVRPMELTDEEQAQIGNEASKMLGVKYSFLDYIAIILHHFKINLPWVKNRVTGSGHQICSQLIAEVYRRIGKPLFEGEWPGYVVPADFLKFE